MVCYRCDTRGGKVCIGSSESRGLRSFANGAEALAAGKVTVKLVPSLALLVALISPS